MTVARGDIRNQPYNSRAKHYLWGLMCEYFPRGISPTDVDNLIEMWRPTLLLAAAPPRIRAVRLMPLLRR